MKKEVLAVKTHKDLDVWKKSMDFVTKLYKTTISFPKEEIYGLTNQMRRAAVSIPSNIAEGAARKSNKEFIQFLYIALGSNVELETQLIISKNLKFINDELFIELEKEIDEIGRMLFGLIKYRRSREQELETRDMEQETRNQEQETRDMEQETRKKEQET